MFVLVNLDARSLDRTEACILFSKGIQQERNDVLGLWIHGEGREFFFCSCSSFFHSLFFFAWLAAILLPCLDIGGFEKE